jgi:hypothetical protein
MAFEIVTEIRNTRNTKGLSPKEALKLLVKKSKDTNVDAFWSVIKKLSNLSEIGFITSAPDSNTTPFLRLDAHPRLGVCLDSCHWWVSGVDVADREALDAAVRELDERIGLDRLRCLHVNDAEVGLGSNRDRHTTLGKGTIGKGMATFLAHPAFQGLPAILETPDADGSYAGELRLLRRLHKKGLAAS